MPNHGQDSPDLPQLHSLMHPLELVVRAARTAGRSRSFCRIQTVGVVTNRLPTKNQPAFIGRIRGGIPFPIAITVSPWHQVKPMNLIRCLLPPPPRPAGRDSCRCAATGIESATCGCRRLSGIYGRVKTSLISYQAAIGLQSILLCTTVAKSAVRASGLV